MFVTPFPVPFTWMRPSSWAGLSVAWKACSTCPKPWYQAPSLLGYLAVTFIEWDDDPLNGLVLPKYWGCPQLQAAVTIFLPHFSSMRTVTSIPSYSYLGCLLENFHPLPLAPDLKSPKPIHFCNQIWPQYPLDNHSKWLPNSILYPNIIQDLYNYWEL